MPEPSAALSAVIAADHRKLDEADLPRLRALAQTLRDKRQEAKDLEERLAAVRREITDIEHKQLVDLMNETGTDRVGLPAEGNQPACDAKLRPYYHASIQAEWPPEKKQAAYDWLESNGHGDLLKAKVTVNFGLKEMREARELEESLRGQGLAPQVDVSVPWSTLTAWLREQVEKYRRTPPLDVIGGTVGQVVKLTERKD